MVNQYKTKQTENLWQGSSPTYITTFNPKLDHNYNARWTPAGMHVTHPTGAKPSSEAANTWLFNV